MICKICHEENENMISPCACDGTIKWVHPNCVSKWVQLSGSVKCPECGEQYATKENYEGIFPESLFKNLSQIGDYYSAYKSPVMLLSISILGHTFLDKLFFTPLFKSGLDSHVIAYYLFLTQIFGASGLYIFKKIPYNLTMINVLGCFVTAGFTYYHGRFNPEKNENLFLKFHSSAIFVNTIVNFFDEYKQRNTKIIFRNRN